VTPVQWWQAAQTTNTTASTVNTQLSTLCWHCCRATAVRHGRRHLMF
jgi:hypothetical protein